MKTTVLILVSVFLNSIAQLCMKKGMMLVGEITGGLQGFLALIPDMITNLYLWISGLCYVVSMVLWLVVLSKVDVSYAYPFLSIGYIFVTAVGCFTFHETITYIRFLGVLIISIGVILISKS